MHRRCDRCNEFVEKK